MEVLCPAELNLFLHITCRRQDGYHELQSVFQLLDWGDTMRFESNERGIVTVAAPGLALPAEDNLALRAAHLLGGGRLGAHIEIDKRIPEGGGLGGGSSNAATTLLVLNRLWHLGHDSDTLRRLGASLGADVPVFIGGHSAWAEGIGEVLTPLQLDPAWYLIIHPGCSVSTREIFSRRELTRNSAAIKIAAFFEGRVHNDCQPVVRALYPKIDEALTWLNRYGTARLTGTGACVFSSFPTEAEARSVADTLPARWRGFVARGVNESPLLDALV